MVENSQRTFTHVCRLISEFKESLVYLANKDNLKSTFFRKNFILYELLNQGNKIQAAQSEITMSNLLSLIEGLDDNLKEMSPSRKVSQSFNFKKNNSQQSTAGNSPFTSLSSSAKSNYQFTFWKNESRYVTNKKLRYCVGRLYNWLSILEKLNGKEDFS